MLMRKPVSHLMVRMLLPPPPAWCNYHSGLPWVSLKACRIRWCIYSFHHGSLIFTIPMATSRYFWRVFHIRNCPRVAFAELQEQKFSSPPLLCLCHMCSSVFVLGQWLLPAQIRLSCISIFGAKTWVGVRSATTARWCLCRKMAIVQKLGCLHHG